jgi:Protein of unknown function (DUF3631)
VTERRVTVDDFNDIPDMTIAADVSGVDLDALLGFVEAFVRRFVVMSEAQAIAVALWVAHSHAADAADATPYLSVTSAEKQSGKSRLLEVVALLVHKPLRAAGVSEAALFRSLGAEHPPTVLMDEVDAVFGPKASANHEVLRALLNAGYQRGTPVLRCVGDGSKMRVEAFQVFGPKALAGIGELPHTVADRSLPIRLKRRARSERVDRFRLRDAAADAAPLRDRLAEWAKAHLDELRAARPAMPDELDDRAQDAAEPLLAIADLAAGDWPRRARRALVELRGARDEAETLGIRLLADTRAVFERLDVDRLATADLLEALGEDDEAPWHTYAHGSPLTPRQLARLLGRYEIRSRTVRLPDGTTPKGYVRESFEDAWNRYVALPADFYRHNATTSMDTAIAAIFDPPQVEAVEPRKPASAKDCGGVADKSAKQPTRGFPLPGDGGFLEALLDAGNRGLITEREFDERAAVHELILRGRAAAA